jgi:hypothetical protein
MVGTLAVRWTVPVFGCVWVISSVATNPLETALYMEWFIERKNETHKFKDVLEQRLSRCCHRYHRYVLGTNSSRRPKVFCAKKMQVIHMRPIKMANNSTKWNISYSLRGVPFEIAPSVTKTLHLFAYKYQVLQAVPPTDRVARKEFARVVFDKVHKGIKFIKKITISHKALIQVSDKVNIESLCILNLKTIVLQYNTSDSPRLNVWRGMLQDNLSGPVFCAEANVTSTSY